MAFGMTAAQVAMVGVGASVAGNLLASDNSSNAASNAAQAQQQSSADAIAEQRRQYDQTRSDQAPFRNTGVAANSRLRFLLGLGGNSGANGAKPMGLEDFSNSTQHVDSQATRDDYYNNYLPGFGGDGGDGGGDYGSLLRKFTMADRDADPVYQSGLEFGLNQGKDAINARAIANGGYDSGATLKALTRYGNDYGSTKANESYNRYNTTNDSIYNKLAGVSGTGQQATNQVTAAGQNMAANNSGLITGAGNASAAGIVGGANAWGGALNGVNNAMNTYQSNQTLQKLLAGRNGGNSWADYSAGGSVNPYSYADNYG